MNTSTIRSGFSLVELLIVIAIIGILIQLALPAIESSREAARRTACQNNLRQVGLAMMQHEAALKHLPTAGWGWAWIGDPDRGTGESQPGSWAYQLLPYMEQEAVYNMSAGLKGDDKYTALTQLAATPVATLYCPSRRLPRATPNVGPQVEVDGFTAGELFWYNAKKAEKLARTDYAANAGDRFVYWNEGPPPDKAEVGEGFFKFRDLDGKEATVKDINGVAVQRRPFVMQQITDGQSKTYFAGEKSIPKEAYKAGWNLNDDQSCWNGDDLDMLATTSYIPRRDFSVKDKLEGRVGVPFGSAHLDGLNMLFCDGAVRLVAYGIDPELHRQAGNRCDHQAIESDGA